MREPKSIVSYQTTEYGHVKVTLANVMDARRITRNRLRTLTGVKYDVIDRYYKGRTSLWWIWISWRRSAMYWIARLKICFNMRGRINKSESLIVTLQIV